MENKGILLGFLKTSRKSANYMDRVVSWWTSPFSSKFNGQWRYTYSHCEVIKKEADGSYLMYSASSRNNDGVRVKKHSYNEASWEYISVPDLNEELAIKFIKTQVGKKYDWMGIFGFVSPLADHESKWFCSEIVLRALQIAGSVHLGQYNCNRTSPNRLYALVKDTYNIKD